MCDPFIKWVGGKRQLLPEIQKRLPKKFNQYFEPFVGGGAVFFALSDVYNLQGRAHLSDLNEELINAYQVVRDAPEDLIGNLRLHKNTEDYFKRMRGKDRLKGFTNRCPAFRASRFIYINKTAFNGLYRVNSAGYCNVSYGHYKKPKICDLAAIHSCSNALNNVSIAHHGFEEILDKVSEGDFVYLDPPYDPVSETASFTAYTANKFNDEMQDRVKSFCDKLNEKGAYFLLSNSYTKKLIDRYKGQYHIAIVDARRNVNCKGSARGKVKEILVRNYKR